MNSLDLWWIHQTARNSAFGTIPRLFEVSGPISLMLITCLRNPSTTPVHHINTHVLESYSQTGNTMEFVAFESFSNEEHLPLPQPSLLLPLKPHIENLGLMLNFSNLKSLLQLKKQNTEEEPAAAESHLAEKYAALSLKALDTKHAGESSDIQTDSRLSALSKRLSRALNPALTDTEIRELFGLLEARHSDISGITDPGIMGSVARKNARGEIEADLIKSHATALADYGEVVRLLENLGSRVKSLDDLVAGVNERLEADQTKASHISKDIHELTKKQAGYKIKKELLANFKRTFTLNEYEQHLLTSGDINADFFAALARAEEINDKCLILLALDDPTLGQGVMAKSTELIQRAVNKILSFCNRALTNLYLMNDKSRTETLHRCMDYLKTNSVRYQAVIDTYVNSRTSVVLEEFAAQTNSKPFTNHSSKDPRPVYYTSHDPVRFVADMLAYVHSVVVNETEILDGLFQDESDDFKATKTDMIGRILGALGRPVKATIEQLMSQETKLSTIHKIYTNLELYLLMFEKLESAGQLVEILQSLLQTARSRITTTVSNHLATVASLNSAQMDLSSDLQPPEWILNFYSELLPLLDKMTGETILLLPQPEHEEFLGLVVDKPIEIFESHLAGVGKTLSKEEVLIFKQNFLDLVLSKIMPLAFFTDKVLELNRKMHGITKEVTQFHLDKLLKECELFDFCNIVNMICPVDEEIFDPAMYEAIQENKLFNEKTIAETNDTMQEVLPNALLDVQNSLMRVNLPAIVSEVVEQVMVGFTSFYRYLQQIVGNFLGEGLFTWLAMEVATLLGVENAIEEGMQ